MDLTKYVFTYLEPLFSKLITVTVILALIQIGIYVVLIIIGYKRARRDRIQENEHLAQRTAEEICKRMLIIEKQKTERKEEKEDPGYRKAFEPGEMSTNA